VVVALILGLRVACDESGVHGVLMIVIVRERSMDLGWCQIGILFDDLRRTIAMGHVIRDDVDYPMTGAVDARDSAVVQSDVGIWYVLTHLYPPARIVSAW
jgi:hypothetical protein